MKRCFSLLWSKLSSNLFGYWEVILIYPALFLYVFSNDINLISQHGLIYRKLCLREFDESICDSIKNHTNASNYVQELTSQKLIIFNVAFLVPAIFSIIHLASIADRRLNYELPLVVSLIGSLIQSFICIFAVKITDYSLSFYLLLFSQFINGICGAGSLSFISSCFSHVANYETKTTTRTTSTSIDNKHVSTSSSSSSSSSHRSIRYSICESCLLLGMYIVICIVIFYTKLNLLFPFRILKNTCNRTRISSFRNF